VAVLEAIDGKALARAVELAELLVHDVGKQVARTAVNVREGDDVPAALASMLVADLFESAGGGPALVRFEELAGELAALLDDDRIDQARKLLVHASDQERALRDGDAGALRSAARRAKLVHEVLRTLLLDLRDRAEAS
jgi:hypothetical protein